MMSSDRVFDLDDVQALCAASDVAALDWVTLPPRWQDRAIAATTEGEIHDHAYFSFTSLVRGCDTRNDEITHATAVSNAFSAFLKARAKRQRVGPLFSGLEIAHLRRFDLARLRDEQHVSTIVGGMIVFANALGFRSFLEEGETEEWQNWWKEPWRTRFEARDQANARALIQRYLEAEQAVLRTAAEQAMAEPAYRPVRRAHARL